MEGNKIKESGEKLRRGKERSVKKTPKEGSVIGKEIVYIKR